MVRNIARDCWDQGHRSKKPANPYLFMEPDEIPWMDSAANKGDLA